MSAKKVRTFNMTGKVGDIVRSTPTSKRLHIGDMRSGKVYAVLDFRVYPSNTYTPAALNGTLTMKEDSTTDPVNPDFSNTGEIAWSQYNQEAPHSGIGAGYQVSQSRHRDDEKYFAKDVILTVTDETGTQDINYYVKIAEFDATEDVSSIVQLNQFAELLGQTL